MRIQGECKLDRIKRILAAKDLTNEAKVSLIIDESSTDGQSGVYACGDGSIEPSLKQEKECLVS